MTAAPAHPRWRLHLIIPLALAVLTTSIAGYSYRRDLDRGLRAAEHQAQNHVTQVLARLQGTLEYLLRHGDLARVREEMAALGSDPQLTTALLADAHGMTLASLRRSEHGLPASTVLTRQGWPAAARAPIAPSSAGNNVRLSADRLTVTGVYPLALGATAGDRLRPEQGTLYVRYGLADAKAAARAEAQRQALPMLLLLAAVATVLWLVLHRVVAIRVRRLTTAAAALAGGDLTARAGLGGRDELALLGHTFDDMAEHIGNTRATLLRERERLSLALETAQMGIWEWDVTDDTVIWSPEAARLFGAPPGGLGRTYQAFLRHIHPYDAEFVTHAIDRALATEDAHLKIEHRILRTDGALRWVAGRAHIARAADGSPQRVTGIMWDITERKTWTEVLRESEQRYQTLAALSPVGIFRTDAAGDCVFVNDSWLRMAGLDARAATGKGWTAALHPDDRERITTAWYHAATQQRPFSAECRFQRPDGGSTWIYALARPQHNVSGELTGYVGTITDISELKQVELMLAREKERAEVTLHSISDGVVTTDSAGIVDYMNPVAEQLTGWQLSEARGRPAADVLQLADRAGGSRVPDPVQACLRSSQRTRGDPDTVLIDRHDRQRAVEYVVSPLRDRLGDTIGSVLVLRDVGQERALSNQLSWQASHDALTGLINRVEFEQRAERALKGAQSGDESHVLLYVDLDQFKLVNDTCGHVAGDELLRQLTQLLQARMRDTDVLARLGGDELGILLQHCSVEHATRIAEQLRQAVDAYRFNWDQHSFGIGVSIGITQLHSGTRSLAEALAAADLACYAAKDAGRNRVHLYRDDDAALAQRHGEMHWVSRLHRALDNGQLLLYRQSIRAAGDADGDAGHELLLRLKNPDSSLSLPGAFLPAADRYNLMPVLDRWVLRAALDYEARQPDTGHPGILAINLSGTSLSDPQFLEFAREQLSRLPTIARRLCFEITETTAIAQLAQASRFMSELRELGCRFALDDFGSGMSSFAYLRNLPVDFIKIDGGFVRDVLDDPVSEAMVEAVIRIGHLLGIRVIAECVETDAVAARMRELGVDMLQGYCIDLPQPLPPG